MINKENNVEKLSLNLYSRQVGLYGLETMKKIMNLKIFIYGMRGLGLEIAKNIILAGPYSVNIFDPSIAKINDLTSNFYLTKEDVNNKKRRDKAIIDKLRLLNPFVKVKIIEENNILDNIKNNLKNKELKYDVAVISEYISPKEIIEINEMCRKNGIGFIYTSELGIFGFCFVDFGNEFKVIDQNGKEPLKYYVKSITKAKKGIVTIDTTSGRLRLGNNKKVTFKEIEGMTELNNCEPISIKYLKDDSLEISDTSNFSDYISGGIMIEVKSPKILHFSSLKERFETPYTEEDNIPEQTDASKENTNEMIHIGIIALNKFYMENNCLPELNNKKHAKQLLSYGREVYEEKKKLYWLNGIEDELKDFHQIFEKVILRLSLWARAEISPISSFLGGISAQEIVKYTGKYIPIHQWIWFDFSETVENLDDNIERRLMNDRYDDQIAIYGNKIQEYLCSKNIFIIGAGALGCEFIKTFALMGISTNKDKTVIITDNDNIELSNLNRQFLYKQDNIGEPKTIVACKEVKKMNNNFNIYPMKARVGIENENIFNENFWKKQDFIINAVDNIEARLYISEQCMINQKILIDSGTLGTIANSHIIIPFKTTQYTPPKQEDIEQRSIAMCTLRNYPTQIEHCIEWARDSFESCFVTVLEELKRFSNNKEKFFKELDILNNFDEQIKVLNDIIKYSKLIINKNYDDCLEIAYNEYNQKFNNDIIQIITDNPSDSINEDGSKFWSMNKRFPIPLPFNEKNSLIIFYIKKYADILANSLSISLKDDFEYIRKKCLSFKTEKFIPTSNKNNKNSFNKRYNMSNDNEIEDKKQRKLKKIKEIESRLEKQKHIYEKLKEEVNKINIPNNNDQIFKIKEFEKDDDSNGHIEFLYAASNLRATNFRIDNCNIYKVKMIAGKIVPAVATTTASIVGIVSLQIYTLCQNIDLKYIRDCNIIMTYNHYSFISPMACRNINDNENNGNIIYIPEKFTVWDFLEVKNSFNIKEFIEYMYTKYEFNVESIFCNNLNLYELESSKNKINDKIEDIYNEISKIKLIKEKRFIILDVNGKKGSIPIIIPRIKYIFKDI